jgi:pimeloyl-ACP methyl ester carboxylesterase
VPESALYRRGGIQAQFHEPGTLLDAEQVPMPGYRDVTAWRVLYTSRTLQDETTGVTGMVVVPDQPDPLMPVLSWCHGTVGIGDHCAPSHVITKLGLGSMRRYLNNGQVVVATDYEGLGTPGIHPYLVGESEGRSAIDIVRAAGQLPGVDLNNGFFTSGHSQGGHASLWAGIIASLYAVELDLRGVVAIAPPSNFDVLAESLKGSFYRFYLPMALQGIAAAYSNAVDLSDIMTPEGVENAAIMELGDVGDIMDLFGDFEFDELFPNNPFTTDPWDSLIKEQDPSGYSIEAPVLILHGEEDEQIPYACSKALLGQLHRAGTETDMYRYPKSNHCSLLTRAHQDAIGWMSDLVFDPDEVPAA